MFCHLYPRIFYRSPFSRRIFPRAWFLWQGPRKGSIWMSLSHGCLLCSGQSHLRCLGVGSRKRAGASVPGFRYRACHFTSRAHLCEIKTLALLTRTFSWCSINFSQHFPWFSRISLLNYWYSYLVL